LPYVSLKDLPAHPLQCTAHYRTKPCYTVTVRGSIPPVPPAKHDSINYGETNVKDDNSANP